MVTVVLTIIFWVTNMIQKFMITITIQTFLCRNVGSNIFLGQKYLRVAFYFFATGKKHSFVSEPSNIKLFAFCPSFQLYSIVLSPHQVAACFNIRNVSATADPAVKWCHTSGGWIGTHILPQG